MNFFEQAISGVWLIKPHWIEDERGAFSELMRESALADAVGYAVDFVQDNESVSQFGVVRGLHYQRAPCAQAKLVRVLAGHILDVAVDLRPNSPTYGQHMVIELTAQSVTTANNAPQDEPRDKSQNHNAANQIFIPKGFAHGFVVLSKSARVHYKVDAYYAPEHEAGLRFDCPVLAIDWRLPIEQLIVSARDRALPGLVK